MLRFPLLKSKVAAKEREFAFGGLRVDYAHLSHRRKLEGIKNSDPPVFVVPKFDYTVMSEWVKRQLDVALEQKTIPIPIGGKQKSFTVEQATITYFIVDDAQRLSGPLTGEVFFSTELVHRLVEHFSKKLTLADPVRDMLDEASGIVSWAQLEKNGHGKPMIDQSRAHVLIEQP